ncbi:MAG: ABC transporter substrate-binding protein [Deltaproteobacteria bacterium]|nr:ABC transporter substrate-binding protein [Deltaproteobacteria bacterium]
MKRERMAVILGVVLLVGLFFTFSVWGADVVKIGFTGPLSGGQAQYGKNVLDGMNMAAEEINAKGGITVAGKKYKIEVVGLDDQYKPDLTAQNARRMNSLDKVLVIMNPTAGGSFAMMNFNEKDGFLILSGTTDPGIVNKGNKLVVRTPSDTRLYVTNFLDKAVELGVKKMAALPGVNEYSKTWMELFKEEWAKRKGVITDVSPADYSKETDFYTHLTKLIAGKPDGILLIGPSEPCGLIVKQSRELGFKGRFIMAEQSKMDEMLKVTTMDKMEGVIGATPFVMRPVKDSQAFISLFKKRFPEKVITYEAANGYECVYFPARAMEIAGTVSDALKIRAAFPKLFPLDKQGLIGPTGVVGIRDNGAFLRVTWGSEVIGGKFAKPFEIRE